MNPDDLTRYRIIVLIGPCTFDQACELAERLVDDAAVKAHGGAVALAPVIGEQE
jgi:hypothetical protein